MRRSAIAVAALVALGALWTGDVRASANVDTAYGKLPLSFEQNRGQFDTRVRYAARGPGYTLFLTPGESVLDLRGSVIRMRLAGARKNPAITGLDALPGRVNYYRTRQGAIIEGNRIENVATYASVRYANVYRGVDLIYHGNQRNLEYDFVVAPGADPRVIRLVFDGVDRMQLSDDGDLVLHVRDGEVRQHKPIVHQEIDGVRRSVEGRYVMTGPKQVSFELGSYDRSRPLTIDPVVSYGTYLGGSNSDYATAVAVDPMGNSYITGQTQSTNFPLSPPDPVPIGAGHFVLFVAKFNSTGTALIYSTYFDDWPNEIKFLIGRGIKADANGNAYVTGEYSGALVLRLNAVGTATFFGALGTAASVGRAIAIDGAGYAYITGGTSDSNFATPGSFQPTINGSDDAFITKVNTNVAPQASLVYSTYFGGSNTEAGNAITIDSSGNAYVTGETFAIDFPVTAGAFQTTHGGSLRDAFVTKLNASGSALLYSTVFGGDSFDQGDGIGVDSAGNIYIMGYVKGSDLPTTPGAYQTAWNGGDCDSSPTVFDACPDAFVAKFNPSAFGAASLVYSTYLGTAGFERAFAFAVDSAGTAFVGGNTVGTTTFPSVNPLSGFTSANSEGFISRFNSTGSALLFSSYYSATPSAFALDGSGGLYIGGGTFRTSGVATSGAYQTMLAGADDAFVAKITGFPVPPSITSQPQNQTIVVGGTAMLSVTATGGGLTYQWYFGMSGNTSSPISGATSSSYSTPLTNNSRFWVRVTSGSEAIDSATALVTVVFTDDPLISGVSVMRAVHINQLRTRINGLRARNGIGPFATVIRR